MLGLPVLEGTNPASCYPRSAIGYEAACYSHIWSEVWISYLSQVLVLCNYCRATNSLIILIIIIVLQLLTF